MQLTDIAIHSIDYPSHGNAVAKRLFIQEFLREKSNQYAYALRSFTSRQAFWTAIGVSAKQLSTEIDMNEDAETDMVEQLLEFHNLLHPDCDESESESEPESEPISEIAPASSSSTPKPASVVIAIATTTVEDPLRDQKKKKKRKTTPAEADAQERLPLKGRIEPLTPTTGDAAAVVAKADEEKARVKRIRMEQKNAIATPVASTARDDFMRMQSETARAQSESATISAKAALATSISANISANAAMMTARSTAITSTNLQIAALRNEIRDYVVNIIESCEKVENMIAADKAIDYLTDQQIQLDGEGLLLLTTEEDMYAHFLSLFKQMPRRRIENDFAALKDTVSNLKIAQKSSQKLLAAGDGAL